MKRHKNYTPSDKVAYSAFFLRIGSAIYPVETYADASEMVLAALAKYDGYYRDLPRFDILNSRGWKCGRVSTNGRVWLGSGDGVQVWPPRHEAPQISAALDRPGSVGAE